MIKSIQQPMGCVAELQGTEIMRGNVPGIARWNDWGISCPGRETMEGECRDPHASLQVTTFIAGYDL